MKCISRALAVLVLVFLGPPCAFASAAGATKNDSAANSAISVVREPTPGALRPLPAAFTRPVPNGIAELRGIEKHIRNLISHVSPSVVGLEIGPAEGSGVVISADGLVLTAGHVARSPGRSVKITFPDGKTAQGKTLGALETPDCGLVRITDPGPWPHTDVAGARQARPGDWVLALGHPGGFDPERSLVARFGRVVEVSEKAVRTDCTITTGDSGGPLIDMHGRVLGIHSYISNGFDDNYHIPITKFIESWAKLTGGSEDHSRTPKEAAALKLN